MKLSLRKKRKSRDAYRRVALHCPKCGRSNFLTSKGLAKHRVRCGGSGAHKALSRAMHIAPSKAGKAKSRKAKGSRQSETFYVHIVDGPSRGTTLGPVKGEYARVTMMLRYGPGEYPEMPSDLVTVYRKLRKLSASWRLETSAKNPTKAPRRGSRLSNADAELAAFRKRMTAYHDEFGL